MRLPIFGSCRLNRFILATTFIFTGLFCSAQQAGVDSLIKKFDDYRVSHSTEKIYAHLDQDLYLTGEILWFKLYVVDASLHKPSDISKVAYFEIVDTNNKPVLQTKIALQNGFGNGSIFLPASIQAGNYHVRAYTNWMKNFGPDFFFHKSITIINTFRKLEQVAAASKAAPDAQFFPEGGKLVAGIKSKVAFRVIDNTGKGIKFQGTVINQNKDTITSLVPLKFGMGSFDFTPEPGDTYQVLIEDERGQKSRFNMPTVLDKGYVMRVNDSTDNLLSISIRSNLASDPYRPVYIFVHARNIVSTAAVYFLRDHSATVVLPKKDLQQGISHITLFNSELQPVCERLYFTPVKNKMVIEVQPSQREFGIRRKVSVDIRAQNEEGQPQAADLSVAVYKTDSLQQENGSSILSYFWLSADLSGVVESPEYYMNNNPDVKKAIDNVMLTHGWTRFTWNDITKNGKTILPYPPEFMGHIIQGRVTDLSGAPSAGTRTYLSSPSKNIQIYASISNSQGDVRYEMKDFYGPRKIIAQTNTLHDSTSQIEILSPFADTFSIRPLAPFFLLPSLKQELISRSIGMQVQDVFYQDRSNKFKTTKDDTTAFYGKADATYLLDDYTRFTVMEEVMREYVPGVMVRKRKGKFHFMTLDNVNKGVFDEDPMILLDGIPIFDVDKIMAFDPLLVKKLEIINRRYYMGVLSMPGIVSYTTYTGDLAGYQLDPRIITLDYEGLQLQREFYLPKYETAKQRETRLPDQRNLLFWAPEIISSPDGRQHVEFFTSDQAGEYRVVIEGLTSGGLMGSGSGTFSVRHFDN